MFISLAFVDSLMPVFFSFFLPWGKRQQTDRHKNQELPAKFKPTASDHCSSARRIQSYLSEDSDSQDSSDFRKYPGINIKPVPVPGKESSNTFNRFPGVNIKPVTKSDQAEKAFARFPGVNIKPVTKPGKESSPPPDGIDTKSNKFLSDFLAKRGISSSVIKQKDSRSPSPDQPERSSKSVSDFLSSRGISTSVVSQVDTRRKSNSKSPSPNPQSKPSFKSSTPNPPVSKILPLSVSSLLSSRGISLSKKEDPSSDLENSSEDSRTPSPNFSSSILASTSISIKGLAQPTKESLGEHNTTLQKAEELNLNSRSIVLTPISSENISKTSIGESTDQVNTNFPPCSESLSSPPKPQATVVNLKRCTECSLVFQNGAKLRQHILSSHSASRSATKNSEVDIVRCPECQIPFSSKSLLDKHFAARHLNKSASPLEFKEAAGPSGFSHVRSPTGLKGKPNKLIRRCRVCKIKKFPDYLKFHAHHLVHINGTEAVVKLERSSRAKILAAQPPPPAKLTKTGEIAKKRGRKPKKDKDKEGYSKDKDFSVGNLKIDIKLPARSESTRVKRQSSLLSKGMTLFADSDEFESEFEELPDLVSKKAAEKDKKLTMTESNENSVENDNTAQHNGNNSNDALFNGGSGGNNVMNTPSPPNTFNTNSNSNDASNAESANALVVDEASRDESPIPPQSPATSEHNNSTSFENAFNDPANLDFDTNIDSVRPPSTYQPQFESYTEDWLQEYDQGPRIAAAMGTTTTAGSGNSNQSNSSIDQQQDASQSSNSQMGIFSQEMLGGNQSNETPSSSFNGQLAAQNTDNIYSNATQQHDSTYNSNNQQQDAASYASSNQAATNYAADQTATSYANSNQAASSYSNGSQEGASYNNQSSPSSGYSSSPANHQVSFVCLYTI